MAKRLIAILCGALLMVGWAVPAFAQSSPPSPAPGAPTSGIPVNRSGLNSSATITTGNTFQTVLPSIFGTSTQRQSLTIENNNTNTDNCWVHVDPLSPTKGNSILLLPGGSYTRYWPYVPSDAIQVTCASTSDTIYVDNQ